MAALASLSTLYPLPDPPTVVPIDAAYGFCEKDALARPRAVGVIKCSICSKLQAGTVGCGGF